MGVVYDRLAPEIHAQAVRLVGRGSGGRRGAGDLRARVAQRGALRRGAGHARSVGPPHRAQRRARPAAPASCARAGGPPRPGADRGRPGPAEAAERHDVQAAVQSAVAGLSAERRAVVEHVLDGFTLVQTAASLGVPEGTAKSRARAAYAELRRGAGGTRDGLMSLSPDTKTAVLRRFVRAPTCPPPPISRGARSSRSSIVLAAAAFAVTRPRANPSDARAARFVDAVSYGQRGHLRIAQTGDAGRDRLRLEPRSCRGSSPTGAVTPANGCACRAPASPSAASGRLSAGEDGTVNLSWSGRRDLAVFDAVSLRAADGSVVGRGPLVKRTG